MTEIIIISDLKDPNDSQGRSYREVNNARVHKFTVGQLVEIEDGVRMFVAKQSRDCDGTPLYCLTHLKDDYTQNREGFANHNWVTGISEDYMSVIIKEKK